MNFPMAVMLLIAAALFGSAAFGRYDGCLYYWPTRAPLIAHGGGGLPDKKYPNNLAALDLSASHGHRLIELDMHEHDGEIRFGHDVPTDLTMAELLQWLDRHPDLSIVTDFKTSNIAGLAALKKLAGHRQDRFIPQIYRTEQYEPVLKLGYPKPIFSVGRDQNPDWVEWVNSHDVRAVTVPIDLFRRGIRKPLYIHTFNVPLGGVGLYTDCLVPA